MAKKAVVDINSSEDTAQTFFIIVYSGEIVVIVLVVVLNI